MEHLIYIRQQNKYSNLLCNKQNLSNITQSKTNKRNFYFILKPLQYQEISFSSKSLEYCSKPTFINEVKHILSI